MNTLLPTQEIATSENPTASVIWMHGLGDSSDGFAPIVKELDLNGAPGIRFIFPDAPTIPVTINNGYVMPAWYDIRTGDLVQREDEAGLRKSQTQIEALIAQERARGIAANKIVIAGFSQGCAMALQIGLRHPEKLAGLMCLSGYLPLADKIATERHAANQTTPIFMAHGQQDPVVPLARAVQSRDLLQRLDYQIAWHEYAMQHSVCAEEVRDIATWLRQVLAD
ncbi:MAG: alpha/beta hydrolase [Glaciimonas sp.]|nr:alpha/beta hydrolase [Glaciimonas sp.]